MTERIKCALVFGGLALFLVVSSAGGYYLWRFGPTLFRRAGEDLPGLAPIDPERARRGTALYATNCARCHGERAEGNPDWRELQSDGTYLPPPHDNSGHTWHHSDQLLLRIVKEGGQAAYGTGEFKSGMPAFGELLTDDEIEAILAYFKTLWGPKEREFQASVTAQERNG